MVVSLVLLAATAASAEAWDGRHDRGDYGRHYDQRYEHRNNGRYGHHYWRGAPHVVRTPVVYAPPVVYSAYSNPGLTFVLPLNIR